MAHMDDMIYEGLMKAIAQWKKITAEIAVAEDTPAWFDQRADLIEERLELSDDVLAFLAESLPVGEDGQTS